MNQGDFLICVGSGGFLLRWPHVIAMVGRRGKEGSKEGGKYGSLFLFWKEDFCFEIREGMMGKCRGERVKTRTSGGIYSRDGDVEFVLL